MELSEHLPNSGQYIARYSENGFVIDGVEYTHNIILTPNSVEAWTVAELQVEAIRALAQRQPSLLIIGTGEQFTPLPSTVSAPLLSAGIAHEAMSTAAACRTLSILHHEGRDFIAALLLK